ncbi:MAG: YbaN family protein [Spirochaetales bacterium]|nr:YbaN family protein [Spirochaetales bacterium]
MKKFFLLITGHLFLSLGITGIFLPVLPTTPFLLLSAACYMKSSERLYTWLVNHKFFGLYIRSYLEYKAITQKAKILSIIALWSVMMITILFFINLFWIRVLLIFIAIGVTFYLIQVKTLTKEMLENFEYD